MKRFTSTNVYIAIIILLFLLCIGTALAIKPLEDQLPPNVPKENVTIGKEIEEDTIVVKRTNMSIARMHRGRKLC